MAYRNGRQVCCCDGRRSATALEGKQRCPECDPTMTDEEWDRELAAILDLPRDEYLQSCGAGTT